MRFLSVLSFCSGAIAATVRGSIDVSTVVLPANTDIILRSATHELKAPLFQSGEFRFDHVETDSYVLLVYCKSHAFAPLRVDVTQSSSPTTNDDDVRVFKTTRGTAWSQVGPRQTYPIVLKPTGVLDYYILRPSFNLLPMLKNPMVLIGILMVASILGLPKLTQLLDPEGVEEMERIKAERVTAAKNQPAQPVNKNVEAFQNFDVSGWLAGKK